MARPLSLLCWEGYHEPGLLEPFRRRHNVSVAAETLLSDYAAAVAIAADPGRWDVVNLNNPFARDFLYPRRLVRALDRQRFDPFFDAMLPWLRPCYRVASSPDGASLLGVCQRFGPFNLVVNTRRISASAASDQGFALADDPRHKGRFGILAYDDFNVFHIAIGAGIDPFQRLGDVELARFEQTSRHWHGAARLVDGDHLVLNRALAAGDIDFYLSGGIYTVSPARLAGHGELRAVTPMRGPIGGKGGILFLEVTSLIEHPAAPASGADFLAYLMQPETAVRAALAAGACNPVTQLAQPAVLSAFTRAQLQAMQWDDLEEQCQRSAEYALAPDYERLHAILLATRAARNG